MYKGKNQNEKSEQGLVQHIQRNSKSHNRLNRIGWQTKQRFFTNKNCQSVKHATMYSTNQNTNLPGGASTHYTGFYDARSHDPSRILKGASAKNFSRVMSSSSAQFKVKPLQQIHSKGFDLQKLETQPREKKP